MYLCNVYVSMHNLIIHLLQANHNLNANHVLIPFYVFNVSFNLLFVSNVCIVCFIKFVYSL